MLSSVLRSDTAAAVFSDETGVQEDKPKRVFNLEVKGFKKDEE